MWSMAALMPATSPGPETGEAPTASSAAAESSATRRVVMPRCLSAVITARTARVTLFHGVAPYLARAAAAWVTITLTTGAAGM
jgi:hypothetical protein